MEKLYRKIGDEYIEAGYDVNLTPDGIWLVQSNSMTSLVWRVGEIKKPADIVTHASLQAMGDKLSSYLLRLSEEDSKEYSEAKEHLGNWCKGPIGYYNISASDLVSLFLREMGKIIDIEKDRGEKICIKTGIL